MYRYLLIYISSYNELKYIKLKQLYKENIRGAHKRLLKLKTIINPQQNKTDFNVELIGFDNTVKYTFNKVNKQTFPLIFKKIDSMQLGHIRPGNSIILNKKKTKKQKGLSLYSDYNSKKTLKGTGFKNAETAKKTLELISNKNKTYQKQVVNTMYNRAKYHPHQTEDMRKAMNIFSLWIKNNK
jgi:hypothetical protein